MVPSHLLSRRLAAGFLLAALAIMLGGGVTWMAPGGSDGPRSHASVHPAVRDARFHTPAGEVSVIVQSRGDTSGAAGAVVAAGGNVARRFHIIPALEATLPVRAIDQLARDPAVSRISLNGAVQQADDPSEFDGYQELLESGNLGEFIKTVRRDGGVDRQELLGARTPRGRLRADYSDVVSVFPGAVGATDVWDEGVTGQGVTVAVLDSGVNDSLWSDFGDRVVAKFETSNAGGSHDLYGHGTHVAGIVAGNGEHSGARFMGVAPGARIVSVKVGSFASSPNLADVIEGLQIIFDQREALGIRVANVSLTAVVPESYLFSPLNAAVEQLWFGGVVVVAAAGNRGIEPFSVDHAPANDPWVISVGAFGDAGTLAADDDSLKEWSSRGRTHDGIVKPDVVAPGSRLIASVGSATAELYRQYPDNRVGPYYFRMGGTSAAAPVVSGVAALILEAHPDLTPDQVKARIVRNAATVAGSDAPRIDAYAAVFGADAGIANQGTIPASIWVDRSTASIRNEPVLPDGLTWEGLTWEGLTWEGLTWEGLTWEGLTWEGLTWEGLTWEGLTWEGLTWEGLTWEGLTWEGLTWEGLTWEAIVNE